jgi:hypothetical protein
VNQPVPAPEWELLAEQAIATDLVWCEVPEAVPAPEPQPEPAPEPLPEPVYEEAPTIEYQTV